MHIIRQLPKPPKTNNIFVLLWWWIKEKYRRRRSLRCLPTIPLPELRRVDITLKPNDSASELKETNI